METETETKPKLYYTTQRMGEVGIVRQGHGHNRVLGHRGWSATTSSFGRILGHPYHSTIQTKKEATQKRQQRRKDRDGL